MEVYERLEAALAYIAYEPNWRQGGYGNADGPVCAEGACHLVDTGSPNKMGDTWLSLNRVALERPDGNNLSIWNDSHTYAEVCDLFREAIRKAKADAGISVDLPSPQPDEKTGDRKVVSV